MIFASTPFPYAGTNTENEDIKTAKLYDMKIARYTNVKPVTGYNIDTHLVYARKSIKLLKIPIPNNSHSFTL